MILGALLHAGVSLDKLREVVARLRLPSVELTAEPVQRGGFAATHVTVAIGEEARRGHRHLPDIQQKIAQAGLTPRVTEQAGRVFTRLAEAEAAVHGIPVENVHFHEVGAADAIVDIVGACAGLEALAIGQVLCSPIPTGSGTVHCEHGLLPVPAPATAELLRGVPLAACDEPAELTTPTGAAILTTLAASFGPPPAMRITSIGYGAGTRENRSRPNILRLLVGELTPAARDEEERVIVLETQVDDATGQVVAFAVERLLQSGALDAYVVPIMMKKGRPGQLLTALARPQDAATLEAILFAETTTLGVRQHECLRHKLARGHETVATPFGPIRVKVGRRDDRVCQAWPEFDDCAAAAREHSVPLRTVQDAALLAWAQQHEPRRERRDR
jgi:uncharacterized protein (TIGR00299 family) protein